MWEILAEVLSTSSVSEKENKYLEKNLALEKQLNELKTNSQSTDTTTDIKSSHIIESSSSDLDTLNKTVQLKLGN